VLGFHAFSGAFVEIVMPGMKENVRLAAFAADGLLIVAALGSLKRTLTYLPTKAFLAFLFFSVFTLLYNLDVVGLTSHLNGLRQPAVFFCSMILLYDILESEVRGDFVRWMHSFLVVFVVLQIPVSVLQFSRYGASDWVGGTLGYGGSGVLTQLLFLIAFYFVLKHGSVKNYTAFSPVKSIPFVLVLIPCALNETKVAFVLLALMVFLLAFTGNILRAVPMLVAGGLLVLLLSFYYSENVKDTEQLLDPQFLERYLVYDSRTTVDVPRFQKMVMMFDRMSRDIPSYVVGMGYGIFMGGNVLEASSYSRTLTTDFRGTRILLNTIWLQGGILAVLTFAAAMFSFLRTNFEPPRNVKSFRLFLLASLLLMWIYNEAVMMRTFSMSLAFFLVWIETGAIEADEAAMEENEEAKETEMAFSSSVARQSSGSM